MSEKTLIFFWLSPLQVQVALMFSWRTFTWLLTLRLADISLCFMHATKNGIIWGTAELRVGLGNTRRPLEWACNKFNMPVQNLKVVQVKCR